MTTSGPGRPFANTPTAKFVDERIERLKSVKSQRDIAFAIGFSSPNILSMIKRGETKLPLDKVPALADALEVDPAHLLHLALQDYLPKLAEVIEQVLGYIATKNEHELLLKPWRAASENINPEPSLQIEAAVEKMLRAIFPDNMRPPLELSPKNIERYPK